MDPTETCASCQKPLSDPKTLPCIHSPCTHCVEVLVKKQNDAKKSSEWSPNLTHRLHVDRQGRQTSGAVSLNEEVSFSIISMNKKSERIQRGGDSFCGACGRFHPRVEVNWEDILVHFFNVELISNLWIIASSCWQWQWQLFCIIQGSHEGQSSCVSEL